MTGLVLAVVLASGPDVYAYNPTGEVAWCAPQPAPKKEGLPIPPEGWRSFPLPRPWCSSGVVIETEAEHKAHGKNGTCPIVEAMWGVTQRRAEKRFQGVQ